MSDFLAAVGLVFVFEGILFAAFPGATRTAMAAAAETAEPRLRLIGLVSAVAGIVIVWVVRSFV
ncbi:MAG TPA: DUF2065 domain-containing protein [Hyphomicrobiales bacterium]|nr:DUF2065 domain-containing protein [Hyphomicrobiales bacterium]